jgi:decaprenyl-phosphate phosphoribosyltransferase
MPTGDGAAARLSGASTLRADARSRGIVRAAIATARPRQWMKNALVIAAPGAARAFSHPGVPVRVGLAFVAFCAIASGIYAINDVHDAGEDRRHPTKCRRPVAAGELSARQAIALGVILIAIGLVICAAVRPLLVLVAVAYIGLTLSYTLVWRNVPFLDVFVISGGFLLRAVAGGAAAPVDLSEWFLMVISFAAVLVAGGKRYGELRRTERSGARRRRVLEQYTERRLTLLLAVCTVGALFTYAVWAFVVPRTGLPWRLLTIIPFTICILRYVRLVSAGEAEAPEELILTDRLLLAGASSWVVLFALGLNASG